MLTIHNATGTLPDDVLIRELRDHVDTPILNRIEGWYDAADRIESGAIEEAREEGRKEAEDAAEPYKNAWEEFYSLWEDNYAEVHWPGNPDDDRLRAIMLTDFGRGAAAMNLLREIADEPRASANSIRERAREVLGEKP